MFKYETADLMGYIQICITECIISMLQYIEEVDRLGLLL